MTFLIQLILLGTSAHPETDVSATARNFLFAADNGDVALTRLLATLHRVTGFLQGTPGGPLPGWYVAGRDNRGVLETLYARLAETYPEAGQPFYATRLWTNIMWQPAYVAVLAVHAHGALPQVSAMAQCLKGIDISGFRLAPGKQREGSTESLIAHAGGELRAMADLVLGEINGLTKLKRVPALRLLTDRMLGLMLRLNQFVPGTSQADQRRFCALWLEAMGLTGQGDLEALRLADGREVLLVARKGCCLDYLAFPDTYCASCPKQDDDVRLQRQLKDALAELEAS